MVTTKKERKSLTAMSPLGARIRAPRQRKRWVYKVSRNEPIRIDGAIPLHALCDSDAERPAEVQVHGHGVTL